MTPTAERSPGRIPGFCALCRSRCGAQFVVEGGRLTGVEPWPEHPTGGGLCAKGRAAPELQYHPQRLTQPLKRSTPRSDPDPKWQPCSWDEALADIACRLSAIREESGGHAVAFSSASPGATALSDSLEWIERLVFAFGSPNFLTGVELCNWQRDHGHAFTFGTGIGMPDYARTDLVMLWGFNPGNVWLAQANNLAQARERGARLLVVDPAPTRHARDADVWLQVRPGTDAVLALGIARELIRSGRFDEGFVRSWSNGPFLVREDNGAVLTQRDLDPASPTSHPLAWCDVAGLVPVDTSQPAPPATQLALRGVRTVSTPSGPIACQTAFDHYALACEPYTAERVAERTGVPPAQVGAAAQLIADARRVSYFSWTGIAQHADATQADRAIALLYALTGCVDAPGGNQHLNRLPAHPANDRRLLGEVQAARALGLAQRPLGPPAHGWTLGEDFHRAATHGEPYRVRALVGFGANLLMSQADSPRMREALQALEFQVHVDMFESPTGRHADYLLPASTPWEREGLRLGFEISGEAQELVQLRPAAVAPPPGQLARSDVAIVFDLAVRLGLADAFFGGDVEAGWNAVLAPLNLSLAQLRAAPDGIRVPLKQAPHKYRTGGFNTPSRRVEFYSPQLRAAGAAPVPQGPAFAEASPDFPLILCGAKSGYYCQSQHRALPSLRVREPEAQVGLHPSLAQARGIAAGDWCEVHTRKGRARYRAVLSEALAPDAVTASFGWWQACEELGLAAVDPLADGHSNINALVDTQTVDPVSGAAPLRSFPCDVRAMALPGGWNEWKDFELRCLSWPAEGVIEVALTAADATVLPDFRPGQYVRMAMEVPGAGRQERCYSLTGPACVAGHGRYTLAVRRDAVGGGMSNALHRFFTATPGGVLRVALQRPAGRFLLPRAPSRPTVLMAAGIGITPFVSMLESMAADGVPLDQPLLLMYGSRDQRHHAFAPRIAALARNIPQLTVMNFYSRVQGDAAGAQPGRVSAQQVPQAWISGDARFYLCGPPGLLGDARRELIARGVPRFAIFSESFDTAGAVLTPAGPAASPHSVVFTRSRRKADWLPEDRSLLTLAERLGIEFGTGCRVGQCESCRVSLRSGRVAYLADVALQQDGDCLACVAVPLTDLEIDA